MRRHETRSSSTESPFFLFPRAHTNTRTHTHEHTRVPDSTGRSFVPSTRLDSAKRSEVKCGVPPIHPSITPSFRGRGAYTRPLPLLPQQTTSHDSPIDRIGCRVRRREHTHTHTQGVARACCVLCIYILYHTVYTYKKYHDDTSTKHE